MNIHLRRRRTRRLNPKSFKTQNLRSFSHLHRATTRGCVPHRYGKNSLAAEDAKGASRVCRSVGHSHSSHWRRPEDERTKKASHSPPLSLSLFFEDGLELRGSLSLAEKPCRSFSTRARYAGRRRQLDEQHESPGETGSSYRLLVR